ncbi:DUF4256 domain-containing protein [Flavobacterium caeni]|uniref:DUF4256 domain-containing protein n=1 Tax=Flavobacterium caeni TaxID=490189 RepID=A0A1G5ITA8_9FLAO|nr:DUF4256 domain-containing protein [Flavobacterium caeni]SCY78951.1 Protein of unknown function [Flavobacterium caeni]
MAKKTLSTDQQQSLLAVLQQRFEKNRARHKGILWADVLAKLEKQPNKLYALDLMEETEGEPDVVGTDPTTGEFLFVDCAPESPKGRRSICYDMAALESRKEHKPKHSAVGMAEEMGIALLTEAQYRHLQQLGAFDLKTSSWIDTPDAIRKLGGALFCDRRFDHVFTYHNGAESYYAARGFRGLVKV